ncbi:MAG: major capsid protein [Oscillospiraceae bacterium]|nr:major capsid protein [Oscillospiraceae bacterium]
MPKENISIYEPRTMEKVISRLPPVRTYFMSTFFNREKTFTTKHIDVDFKKGNRALAPFVHPTIGGKTIANSGYKTQTYTPPLISPNKITTAGDLESRLPGETIYSGKSPAERQVEKLRDDLLELREMVTRRIEWACVQAIYTGKIPVIGEGLNEVIDFNFTNKEKITTAARKWTHKDSDPLGDLKKWRKQVQKTGFVNCDVCVMADDVAAAFINHEKVINVLDIKSYDLAVIKPREMPNGATYIGTIRELGLDIHTYNEWYLDDWTNPGAPVQKPHVPDGTVAMLSTGAAYSMYYGAITMLDGKGGANESFVTVEGKLVPKTWVKHNPDRRFLALNSKPLPVPHEVDSWFIAEDVV